MHSLDLLLLKDVTRKQGEHQQHNHDKQRPGAEELLAARFGRIAYTVIIKLTDRRGQDRGRTIIGIRVCVGSSTCKKNVRRSPV